MIGNKMNALATISPSGRVDLFPDMSNREARHEAAVIVHMDENFVCSVWKDRYGDHDSHAPMSLREALDWIVTMADTIAGRTDDEATGDANRIWDALQTA